MKRPNLKFERQLWRQGYHALGVDEVGRGALSGPVCVGAVCFSPVSKRRDFLHLNSSGINDSKKLNAKKRQELSSFIRKNSYLYSTSTVPVSFVNKKGIAKATQRAMRMVIAKLQKKLNGQRLFVLVDAFYIRYLKGIGLKGQKAIVHGDEISLSIAAASIIAKVERDKIMRQLSKKYPKYFWAKNKGYATKAHIQALKKFGKTRLHRALFLRKILP